jgi:hypothetical protein
MSFRSYDLLNLVRDFGETLTLKKVTTAGTYNPATGDVDGSATTDYAFTGYFYNYDTLNVDQIKKGTRKCVIPALGFSVEPDEKDIITGNGDGVAIVSVTTIFSDGAAVCYLCHVEE